MTILRIIERDVDGDTYRAVGLTLNFERQHPVGLIMHGATEVDGTMRVAQVWDSEQHARRFDEERLRPALEAVGAPVEAEITVYQLEGLVTP